MEENFTAASEEDLRSLAQKIEQELERRAAAEQAQSQVQQQAQELVDAAQALADLTGGGWTEILFEALPDELTDYIALGRISPQAASRLWAQPSSPQYGYARGDTVIYEGKIYTSLEDENFFSPAASPQAWEERK